MVEQPSEPLRRKVAELKRAVDGFEQVVQYDYSGRNAIELDIYKNACIQKFEYCTELGWKTVKRILDEQGGESPAAPKLVYRHYFLNFFSDEELTEALFQTINDRNLLSHVYKESVFDEVYDRLPKHLSTLKQLVSMVQKALGE
ncbi:nucleotidyltransferase substrate binding protein [Larkinella sp. VNQ87]|uniref:nucleotidyltransferase substrate binding protein n=1 Tax=Larkinella sp. VNQ87 TaxID=3400921 RepID=UPI003BFDD83F